MRTPRIVRRTALTAVAAAVGLTLGGCYVVSLEPSYSEDTLVAPDQMELSLLGKWTPIADSDDDSYQFLPGPDNSLNLIVYPAGPNAQGQELSTSPTKTGAFEVHVLKLGNQLLLDLLPAVPDVLHSYVTAHLIPVHTVYKLDMYGSSLTFRTLDEQWLEDELKAGRIQLPYHRTKEQLVLMASTQELQQMLLAHMDVAFTDPQTLERLPEAE